MVRTGATRAFGAREPVAQERAVRDLFVQEGFVEPASALGARRRHEPHARAIGLERDHPPPTLFRQDDADVALALALVALRALVVGEDREVLERRVHAPEAEASGDERLLPRCIDENFGLELEALTAVAPPADPCAPRVGVETRDVGALANVDAGALRVVEQDLIELGAVDLKRRAWTLHEPLSKGIATGERAIEGHELRGVLRQEPALELGQHAKPFEQRHRARQERLADVKPRELLALAQGDVAPALREQGGDARPRWPAPDHDYVEAFGWHLDTETLIPRPARRRATETA
jgi:hypothetical protein